MGICVEEGEKMKLPDFIVCGTQKGGTTALLWYLRQHPDIYMPRGEIHYFTFHADKNIKWYMKHFPDDKVCGEKSPSYMFQAGKVAKRMYELMPDAKLIFMLRNPVKRAYSAYWMYYIDGTENLSFEEAVWRTDSFRDYLERGKYANQIREFLKYFDKEQIMILISEDFRENREERMKEVFDFIGVKKVDLKMPDIHVGGMPRSEMLRRLSGLVGKVSQVVWDYPALRNFTYDVRSAIKKINRIEGKKPPMDEKIKSKLYEYFEPYNNELIDLLKELGYTEYIEILKRKWMKRG